MHYTSITHHIALFRPSCPTHELAVHTVLILTHPTSCAAEPLNTSSAPNDGTGALTTGRLIHLGLWVGRAAGQTGGVGGYFWAVARRPALDRSPRLSIHAGAGAMDGVTGVVGGRRRVGLTVWRRSGILCHDKAVVPSFGVCVVFRSIPSPDPPAGLAFLPAKTSFCHLPV